jgi:prophage tail gpP-like protein
MSKVHNVISGDTLGAISIRYLGTFQKWTKIVNANPQLAGRKTAIDGSPLIFPGDVLIIPDEDKSESIPAANQIVSEEIKLGENELDVSIVIDGKKFTGWTGYEIVLSYDALDAFSFSSPYDKAIKNLRETIMPFAFKNCQVFYDNKPLFKGTLLTPDPELTDTSREITLQGYPLCGILNDCTVPPSFYPGDYEGLTLKDISAKIGDAYGIKVIFQDDAGDPFAEVSFEPTDKILDFFVKLSKQRKLLYTNDENGRLVFFKPKQGRAFVSFSEGELPLISVKPKFHAQNFFSHITGFSKTQAEKDSLSYTWENKYLIKKGITRHQTIMVDDAEDSASLENAVKAHAGRMFAECVSFDLECENHKNEKGELFKKGMTVAVKAPSAMIEKETLFIARTVTLKRSTEAKTASLSLVLPGSFTDDMPEALPWE